MADLASSRHLLLVGYTVVRQPLLLSQPVRISRLANPLLSISGYDQYTVDAPHLPALPPLSNGRCEYDGLGCFWQRRPPAAAAVHSFVVCYYLSQLCVLLLSASLLFTALCALAVYQVHTCVLLLLCAICPVPIRHKPGLMCSDT